MKTGMVTLLSVTLAAVCAARGESVREVLGKCAGSEEIPGAVSAVVPAGGGEAAFVCEGYADIGKKSGLTPDSLFWIASNGKGLAAALALTFVDQGTIRLEDPVEKYLPEWREIRVLDAAAPGGRRAPASKPTVRPLLSHTSGLAFFPQMPIDQFSMRELSRMAVERSLQSDPGTRYAYSNWGIDVAMAVCEVVGEKPWEELLKERILTPLGMRDTTCFPDEGQLARLASAYVLKEGEKPVKTNVDQLQYPYTKAGRKAEAGGGLFSTPRDMIAFFAMIARQGMGPGGRRVLSEETIRLWSHRQTGLAATYSFGMDVGDETGRLSHGGAYQTFGEANCMTGAARLYFVQISGGNALSRARSDAWHRVTAPFTAPKVEGQKSAAERMK